MEGALTGVYHTVAVEQFCVYFSCDQSQKGGAGSLVQWCEKHILIDLFEEFTFAPTGTTENYGFVLIVNIDQCNVFHTQVSKSLEL